VAKLYNLLVDLATLPPVSYEADREVAPALGIEIGAPSRADDRTTAWIDETFDGAWSSEAAAGDNVIARRSGAPVGFATLGAKGLSFRWLRGIARERDVGIFGPFGVAISERKSALGRMLLALALCELRKRGYARALIPAVSGEQLIAYYVDAAGARVAEEFDRSALLAPAPRTLVMASGNGSNFQAVYDAAQSGTPPLDVAALLSNDPRAYAIERARSAGISSIEVVRWNRAEESRESYDERLLACARALQPDLVLLLGWMHLLSNAFVTAFPDLLNLHPAFLPLDPRHEDVGMPDGTRIPAFRGPRAVDDALGVHAAWVGATVHRVTPETDRGPVLARIPLRVGAGEEKAGLMERLHDAEHHLVRVALTRWLYERP
jgi:phosphoribosylglycinamide formyltransferase 1